MSTASASDSPQCVVRYAEQLAEIDSKVSSEGVHPEVFSLHLKVDLIYTGQTFHSYSCGVQLRMALPHKVIMLVGATGAGKSTLINAMTNYILGVKWEDNFRFKLVHDRGEGPQSQAHSQTQNVTSYTIHTSNTHINHPFMLTIVDTPGFGDTRGLVRDKAIVKQIQEFFSHPEDHGVDHIDAVGFVAQSSQARLTPTQSYVFESILAVFGKDIKSNILLLTTFCDGESPKVLEAAQEAKLPFGQNYEFNNSALFASQVRGGRKSHAAMFWQMGYESMKEFFDALEGLEPRSLTLTVEVLAERMCLETALVGLQPLIGIIDNNLDQLNNDTKMLEERKQEIEENKSFEYEAEVAQLERIPECKGSTNCPECLYTCHNPCTFSNKKYFCRAMTRGNCVVCPGKCSSRDHVHENFRYRWKQVKKMQTYADIENRYRDAQGKKRSREEIIEMLNADVANAKAAVSELLNKSQSCTQRLNEIALKPNPIGITEYIDMLIESAMATKCIGWITKVASLKAAKQREKIKAAVVYKGGATGKEDASDNMVKRIWGKVTRRTNNNK